MRTNKSISYFYVISDVILERINRHHNNLKAYPNPLLEPLLQLINTRRLKNADL